MKTIIETFRKTLIDIIKVKTFPERESDEFDAGYAEAIKDVHNIINGL